MNLIPVQVLVWTPARFSGARFLLIRLVQVLAFRGNPLILFGLLKIRFTSKRSRATRFQSLR
uniref:Uncharacterized protein n=1 Tax=uncultured marine virus TaxID=186617 RepID=A0A0F7L7F2_9VIRU|nr:hypothetical protein [uncultured marine virus]